MWEGMKYAGMWKGAEYAGMWEEMKYAGMRERTEYKGICPQTFGLGRYIRGSGSCQKNHGYHRSGICQFVNLYK